LYVTYAIRRNTPLTTAKDDHMNETKSPFTVGTAKSGALGPPPATRLTDFDAVSEALSLARDISNRVEMLADKLVGSQPQEATNGIGPGEPDGVFPRMAQEAYGAIGRLRSAMAALDRIERSLP
jgi:hypothetical protein